MTQIRVPADVAKTDRSNTWTGTQDFTAATVLGVAGGGGGTVSGATAAAAGVVQLAGDLSGTYQAPTVPGLTGKADKAALAAVATTGAYGDLTGRPALAAVATTGAYGDLTGRPALAPVATTGAYGDLTGRPTIPAAPLLAVKAADTNRLSTVTLADDPDLVFPTLAAGSYLVEAMTRWQTLGAKPTLALGPAGGAAVVGGGTFLLADPTTATPLRTLLGASNTSVTDGSNQPTSWHWTGSIYLPSASSLALRWAQSTSDPRNTTVLAGSFLRVTKVA